MISLIKDLFLRYNWSIIITYGLTLLENVFELLYPFIIGITILSFPLPMPLIGVSWKY